jgi:hypothetical protein
MKLQEPSEVHFRSIRGISSHSLSTYITFRDLRYKQIIRTLLMITLGKLHSQCISCDFEVLGISWTDCTITTNFKPIDCFKTDSQFWARNCPSQPIQNITMLMLLRARKSKSSLLNSSSFSLLPSIHVHNPTRDHHVTYRLSLSTWTLAKIKD